MKVINCRKYSSILKINKVDNIALLWFNPDEDTRIYIASIVNFKNQIVIINRYVNDTDFKFFMKAINGKIIYNFAKSIIKNADSWNEIVLSLTNNRIIIELKNSFNESILDMIDFRNSENFSYEPSNFNVWISEASEKIPLHEY